MSDSIKIPKYLTKDVETINASITALKIIKAIKQGRIVFSTRGFRNIIKFYFLGYLLYEENRGEKHE